MPGGGSSYEAFEKDPKRAEDFVLEVRREKIDRVLSLRTRNFTIVLDRLQDSFNMGAVIRTCEGMGLQEVHVIKHPDAPFIPNTKVTQGCEKWLDLVMHKDFAACRENLKSRGFKILASAIREDATSLFQLRFDEKVALVFGNERRGVSQEVLDTCDGMFWIPMRGFSQSLNVSVSVSAAVTQAIAWRDAHLGPNGDLAPEDAEQLRQKFLIRSVKQRKRIFRDRPEGG